MNTKNRKGFTLIATGFCVISLVGMLGLALDLGRVYISKNETQSFTDTAALAAAMKLNGLAFDDARNAITNNTKKFTDAIDPVHTTLAEYTLEDANAHDTSTKATSINTY